MNDNMNQSAINPYRENRVKFCDALLKFDFDKSDLTEFIENWQAVINISQLDTYSPYHELNDLLFVLDKTRGDGKRCNLYLQHLIIEQLPISDETWADYLAASEK